MVYFLRQRSRFPAAARRVRRTRCAAVSVAEPPAPEGTASLHRIGIITYNFPLCLETAGKTRWPGSDQAARLSAPLPAASTRLRGSGRRRLRAGAVRRQHPRRRAARRRSGSARGTAPARCLPPAPPPSEQQRPPPGRMRSGCLQFRCVHLKASRGPAASAPR